MEKEITEVPALTSIFYQESDKSVTLTYDTFRKLEQGFALRRLCNLNAIKCRFGVGDT